MIHTVYSNVYEALRAVLLHNLSMENAEGSGGFFESKPVLVPSRAVGEDLRRALAKADGVCAGYDFMPLSAWMGFFSREPLANIGGNEADWMIRGILSETGPGSFREAAGHERLSRYLEGKSDREIYELSRRISGMFVTYASYRTDWLLAWMRHEDEGEEHARLASHPDYVWQRNLWRKLCGFEDWQGRRYLEHFPETLVELAASRGVRRTTFRDGRTVLLPDALHIFVPFVVPPLMLPLLRAYVHSGRDIWLYLLNPCSEYWFDLLPRRLIDAKPEDAHRECVHEILVDNARSVRANIERLWRFAAESKRSAEGDDIAAELRTLRAQSDSADAAELDRLAPIDALQRRDLCAEMKTLARLRPQDVEVGAASELQSYYLDTHRTTMLHRIQDSVLNLDPSRVREPDNDIWLDAEDRSVQFFSAPSSIREWESLADWLHHLFQTIPDLAPDDVLVATPDPEASAPLVEQVFGSLPEGRRIPWRLSGVARVAEASPAEALRGLAGLMTGRARLEELQAWWSLPPVAARWRFDADALTTIAAWLQDAGCRYGLSDAHLTAVDAKTFSKSRDMTLARALERLALGFMRPEGDHAVWKGLVPVDGARSCFTSTADAPALLERLAQLAQRLEAFRLRTRDASGAALAAEPAKWRRWVEDAVELFFEPSDAWTEVRRKADALASDIARASARSGNVCVVPFELFMTALLGSLAVGSGGAQPGNAVTITGMQAMRGLPYKVVAVVSLSEDCAFPGSSRREEFDLMSAAPRRGDRDSRQDNRNVFLDLLLAAREVFAVSYVAGTGSGSSLKKPSIVAEELRSWILSTAPDAQTRAEGERQLTVRIPLTGSSKSNFCPANPWRSTDIALLEAVEQARASGYRQADDVFADAGIPKSSGWVTTAELDGRLCAVVPFEVLGSYWRHPSRAALACWGIRLPSEDDDDLPGILPAQGKLAQWKRRMEALDALLNGEAVESLEERWSADPRFGGEGVRDWSWQEDMSVAEEIARAVGAECDGWNSVAPRVAHVPLEDLRWRDDEHGMLPVVLRVNVSNLLEKPGEPVRMRIRATPSRIDRVGASSYQVLEHAAAVAAGEHVETLLIGLAEDRERKAMVVKALRYAWNDARAAQDLLSGLTEAVLRVHRNAAWMPESGRAKDLQNHAEDRLLWTGSTHLDDGLRRRSEWQELLESLQTHPEEGIAELVDFWRRACSTPESGSSIDCGCETQALEEGGAV